MNPPRDRRSTDEFKAAMKEALHEWLNEKFMQFGKWSMGGLAALAFAALVYIILKSQGWSPPT